MGEREKERRGEGERSLVIVSTVNSEIKSTCVHSVTEEFASLFLGF